MIRLPYQVMFSNVLSFSSLRGPLGFKILQGLSGPKQSSLIMSWVY